MEPGSEDTRLLPPASLWVALITISVLINLLLAVGIPGVLDGR